MLFSVELVFRSVVVLEETVEKEIAAWGLRTEQRMMGVSDDTEASKHIPTHFRACLLTDARRSSQIVPGTCNQSVMVAVACV